MSKGSGYIFLQRFIGPLMTILANNTWKDGLQHESSEKKANKTQNKHHVTPTWMATVTFSMAPGKVGRSCGGTGMLLHCSGISLKG